MTPDGVLQVKGLSVQFPRRTAAHPPLMAVLDVSFVVGPGETWPRGGVRIGEDHIGARNSAACARRASGEVLWQGLNLLSMDATRLRRQRRRSADRVSGPACQPGSAHDRRRHPG